MRPDGNGTEWDWMGTEMELEWERNGMGPVGNGTGWDRMGTERDGTERNESASKESGGSDQNKRQRNEAVGPELNRTKRNSGLEWNGTGRTETDCNQA